MYGSCWRGKRVLITAGPTREYLDPVRYLSNSSSGRMGAALALAARLRGAKVCVVLGPCPESAPQGVTTVPVVTAEQMRREVLRRCSRADVVIAAAAVSDWRFSKISRHKIKRSGEHPLRLTLIPNPDIIREVARLRDRAVKRQVLVGFALETRRGLGTARRKMKEKGLDLIVANGPEALGAAACRVSLVSRSGPVVRLGRRRKSEVAQAILSCVEKLWR